MNEDISNKDKLRTSVWQGSVTTFDKLVENGELIKGMIYFVGDSASGGLPTSSAGGIYVATSERKAVPFGSSSEHSVKEYRTASSFPTTGRDGRLYIASDTGLMYRWNGSAYVVMGGYRDGYGIDITGAGEIKTEPITDAEIDAMSAGERNGHLLDNLGLVRLWNRIVSFFVQKEDGKGLSTNDYTDSEKNKLAGIEQGAEVNVQSDWNQTNTSADDYIKNKPSVYTKTEIDNMLAAGMHYEVVSSLPSTGEAGTLYLVPSSTSVTGDVYDEYIWLPTEGQVSAHFEKIGTTKADLTNYYNKTEVDNKLADKQDTLTFDTTPTANSTNPVTSGGVKTALDGKQPNISITTNTSTPADNDTVIMQANGVSNTTTFLRRKLSYLWNWIKAKCNSLYVAWNDFNLTLYPNLLPMTSDRLYDLQFDDFFYGAMERFSVTGKIVDSNDQVIEEISSSNLNKIFIPSDDTIGSSNLTEGNTLVININPSGNNTSLFNIYGKFFLIFKYQKAPAGTCTIKLQKTDNTWIESEFNQLTHKGNTISLGRVTNLLNDITVKSLELRINGGVNSFNNTPVLMQFILLSYRNSGRGKVTKHAMNQRFYGNITAPKFIIPDGTNKQALLANGTTASLPLSVANGGTGATTATAAEYNILSKASTYLSGVVTDDNWRIPYISASPSTSNGRIVGYKLPSQMWNYIKSKADLVYSTITETNKKTNRVIDHTWNQPSYSASASGTHVKICDIPSDCVCVMNVRKSVYGYPSINTLWIGNNNSLDFKSLTETDIVATVSSRICTLSVPAHTSSGTPLHTYDFEISVLNKENLSAITWYDDATYYSPSRPTKPNIVMQQSAPVTDGSLAFNVNSSTHVASVSVDGYTDFVGMLTEDSTSAVLVKLSDEAEGSVYRFTFDHAIEGGVSFSNSNASTVYCEVSQDIHAGDTITLTAVSNTSDGWIASVSSAGIISSDNSVGIEWENGVADLKVPVLPPNVVLNRAELGWENDDTIAIGYNSVANCASGDEDFPYAYTANGMLEMFKVDGGTSEYYHEVTAGTTYSITRGNTTISFTPTTSGKAVLCNLRSLRKCLYIFNKYNWNLKNSTSSVNMYPNNMTEVGTSQYLLCVVTNDASMLTSSVVLTYWYKTSTSGKNLAVGKKSSSTSNASTAVGNEAGSFGSRSIAVGDSAKAYNAESVMIGSGGEARGSHSTVVGNSAKSIGDTSTAIGYNAKASGTSSTAVGYQSETSASYGIALGYISKSKSGSSIAIGWNSQSTGSDAIAIGTNSKPNGNESMAIGYGTQTGGAYNNAFGYNAKAGYPSGDSDYPYLQIKRFAAVSFTENGNSKIMLKGTYGEDVTITAFGTTITTTPPNANCLYLIVVNDSWAPRVYRSVGSYAKVNGTLTYIESINLQDIVPVQVTSNHYVFWFRCPNSFDPTIVTSFSFLCLYKSSSATTRAQAFGYNSLSTFNYSNAIGDYVYTAKDYQTVIGTWNIEDEYAKFIIGGGTSSSNRKNILTIDDREIVHARAYISDAVTYELNGASVSLSTITMGLLKVTGGGALTLTSTNAVEGHCVKVYASGDDITCNGDSITAGRWREYLFIDGAWSAQM